MTLTPEEVERHTFRERFRGYDPDEVDAFLDRVVTGLRELQRERDDARAERDDARRGAGESEELLRKTLVTAQRTAEATIADAEREAEQIRDDARGHGERILAEARQQVAGLADATAELAAAHGRVREAIREVLHDHADLLDDDAGPPPTEEIVVRLRALADGAAPRADAEVSHREGRPGDEQPERGSDAAPVEGYPPPPGSSGLAAEAGMGDHDHGDDEEASLRIHPPPPRP